MAPRSSLSTRRSRMWRAASAVLLAGMVGVGGLAAAEAPRPEPPPIPFPDLDNLTPAQAQEALRSYSAAMSSYDLALRGWQNDRLAEFRASLPKVPPAPARPERRGMDDAQWETAFAAWRAQDDAWLAKWSGLLRQNNAAAWAFEQKIGLAPDAETLKREKSSAVALPDGYSWRRDAAQSHLSAETIARLDRESIAVAGPYFRQSFEVYDRNPQPPFVTSDSLLNGFNVLLEDSIRRYERARAGELKHILEDAWSRLGPRLAKAGTTRAALAPYVRQAALVVGPAMRLLGSKAPLGDPSIETEVAAEVRKIEAASDVSLPAWLGPPDGSLLAIDYRRFRPIGLYASDQSLAGYYRAVRWLQMVPFRASRDDEVGGAGLLASLFVSDPVRYPDPYKRFEQEGSSLFGGSDEPDIEAEGAGCFLAEIGKRVPIGVAIGRMKEWMAREARSRPRLVNDQIRGLSSAAQDGAEISVRVLPPSLLPDTAWFAELNRWRGSERLPTGAELGAWLGSPLAVRMAEPGEGPGFASVAVQSWKSRLRMEDLPNRYYNALAALFEPPDPAAPAFMAGEAWQRKSLQTALAGWAQFRHTWELQSKFMELSYGMAVSPAGFVEPSPAFFHALGDAAECVANQLEVQGAFGPIGAERNVRRGAELFRRWQEIGRLAGHLEVLVQKELRGADWNWDDARVLEGYGETLADIMGYEGTSFDDPKDDAPRWTTVAHDPNTDRNLAIAVGRPRALYVLYPWKGTLILCRGAVMTYYETRSPARLTDAEWKARLDGDPPPAQPDWIQPLLPNSVRALPPSSAIGPITGAQASRP